MDSDASSLKPVPFGGLVLGSVVMMHNVWSQTGDSRGNHGVIVVHPPDSAKIAVAPRLPVVCISTKRYPGGVYLPAPFHEDGGPPMGLNQECWVACHWFEWMYPEDAMRIMGNTPPRLLLRIRQELVTIGKAPAERG